MLTCEQRPTSVSANISRDVEACFQLAINMWRRLLSAAAERRPGKHRAGRRSELEACFQFDVGRTATR